jgi:outer membrane usher protein
VNRFDHSDENFLELRGAGVAMAGDLFLSNSIYDSFAVVDTGMPGVTVRHENRAIGKTNDEGRLLVTNLNAYEANRLGIDPTDLPPDVDVPKVREVALPYDRSGVIVPFPLTRPAAASVEFRLVSGAPVPAGAMVSHAGDSFTVGYDGIAYLRGLEPVNDVIIQWDDTQCAARFHFAATPGAIATIGPVTCK